MKLSYVLIMCLTSLERITLKHNHSLYVTADNTFWGLSSFLMNG